MTYKSTLFYIFYYKQQELTPCKSILYHKEAYGNLFYIIRRHKTTVVVVVVGIEGGRGILTLYSFSPICQALFFI